MNSAKERAKKVVDDFVENGLDCGAVMHDKMEKIITLALKEQDKLTRHLIADNLIELPNENDLNADSVIKHIDADDANTAVINSHAT